MKKFVGPCLGILLAVGCSQNQDSQEPKKIYIEKADPKIIFDIKLDKEEKLNEAPALEALFLSNISCSQNEDCALIPTDECKVGCMLDAGHKIVSKGEADSFRKAAEEQMKKGNEGISQACIEKFKNNPPDKDNPLKNRSSDPSCIYDKAVCQEGKCIGVKMSDEESKERQEKLKGMMENLPKDKEGSFQGREPADNSSSPFGQGERFPTRERDQGFGKIEQPQWPKFPGQDQNGNFGHRPGPNQFPWGNHN